MTKCLICNKRIRAGEQFCGVTCRTKYHMWQALARVPSPTMGPQRGMRLWMEFDTDDVMAHGDVRLAVVRTLRQIADKIERHDMHDHPGAYTGAVHDSNGHPVGQFRLIEPA